MAVAKGLDSAGMNPLDRNAAAKIITAEALAGEAGCRLFSRIQLSGSSAGGLRVRRPSLSIM